MAKRVAVTNLNASTIDILNTIRMNASYEYQSLVPAVTQAEDIPRVGEVICGYPAMANQFLTTLINRIAAVRVKSAVFNNPYEALKKGYLEFGETVEEIFVNIAKGVDYSAEKAESREFKRTIPDVRSAFHIMNWRVMYPVTIQDEDLRMAFLSLDGVQDLIARVVDAVYTAANYDEFLLFKYMLIKSISAGKLYPVAFDATNLKEAAVQFRGKSNLLPFMSNAYNAAGVKNTTPKDRQVIFMDATFNAAFDVEVLASAFNMEKADFMGRLHLIDDWTSFDNERFDIIRANSDGLEEVTSTELGLMADVKAVLLDEDWFQVYDNNNKFTEKYVASGLYWNYFYHTWKTVSWSPYANAMVFVDDGATVSAPSSVAFTVDSVVNTGTNLIVTLKQAESDTVQPTNLKFIEDATSIAAGVAIHPYGAIILPITAGDSTATPPTSDSVPSTTLKGKIGNVGYTAGSAITISTAAGATITMAKDA